MRYTQDENFVIKGPGLPAAGAVAIGVEDLEAAFQAGHKAALDELKKGRDEMANKRMDWADGLGL